MKEVAFNFSIEEVNVILKGLAELPAKESFNIIGKIYGTVQEQTQPKPEMAPEGKTVKMDVKK